MISLSKNAQSEITTIYLVANTPPYLYRRIAATQVAQRLAKVVDVSELVAFYLEVGAKRDRDIDEVALAYTALIALTLKEPPPDSKIFERLAKVDFEWGPTLIESFQSRSTSTTTAALNATPPPVIVAPPSGVPAAKVTSAELIFPASSRKATR